MGALVGVMLGVGLLLIWQSVAKPPARGRLSGMRRGPSARLGDLIAAAGLESVSPRQIVATALGLGCVTGLLFLALTRTWPIGLAFGLFGGYLPIALIRYRARQRRAELRELWPDAVDNLTSAVRAGLSLPEALSQLGVRGPEALRDPFRRFGEDYRASGRFQESLDRLRDRLSDPTGDRICESLRIAREVGGTDLGRLLRTLSEFLRADARTRSELESRQSWVINAARLAVAAPWVMLAMLSLRADAVQAFNSAGGSLVLGVGAATCLIAYRLMTRLGRLPDDARPSAQPPSGPLAGTIAGAQPSGELPVEQVAVR
jgi:tight adherence protein B